MNANSLGLCSVLADILNSGKRDSDYAIAHYLATHVGDLDAISITDIMSKAFVTRSAVRRFCNRAGFTSFSELKSEMDNAAYPSDLNHRDTAQGLEAYRHELDVGMTRMLDEMARTVSARLVTRLARRIHGAEHVVLACASNTSGILARFQQELFYAGKVVRVLGDTYRERLSEMASEEGCLIIVVSASGVFARSIEGWLEGACADVCLVTAIPALVDAAKYDEVYRLGETEGSSDTLGLYGKYGVSYFFDLLSACYLHLFSEP